MIHLCERTEVPASFDGSSAEAIFVYIGECAADVYVFFNFVVKCRVLATGFAMFSRGSIKYGFLPDFRR